MDIQAEIAKLNGWSQKGNTIQKDLKFVDFKTALAFMVKVGDEAEKLNHHPDWTNSYNSSYSFAD